MTLAAFQIETDGSAKRASLPYEPGAQGYAWFHFDLSDPELPGFLEKHVPEIPAQSLTQTETRPRCDQYEDGLILNLRGVNLNDGQSSHDMVSLRIWATKSLIVSVRVRRVFAAEKLVKRCDAQDGPETVGSFLTALVEELGDRIENEVSELSDETDVAEDQIYAGSESIGFALGPKRQQAIKLRRYLAPQREALNRMVGDPNPVFSDQEVIALREPVNRAILAVEELESLSDRLDALQQHLDAAAANRLGRNSYVLSIVAAIFLPLGFLTGLFGVNLAGMPGVDWPLAFAAISLSCIVIGVALLAFFQWMKWL